MQGAGPALLGVAAGGRQGQFSVPSDLRTSSSPVSGVDGGGGMGSILHAATLWMSNGDSSSIFITLGLARPHLHQQDWFYRAAQAKRSSTEHPAKKLGASNHTNDSSQRTLAS